MSRAGSGKLFNVLVSAALLVFFATFFVRPLSFFLARNSSMGGAYLLFLPLLFYWGRRRLAGVTLLAGAVVWLSLLGKLFSSRQWEGCWDGPPFTVRVVHLDNGAPVIPYGGADVEIIRTAGSVRIPSPLQEGMWRAGAPLADGGAVEILSRYAGEIERTQMGEDGLPALIIRLRPAFTEVRVGVVAVPSPVDWQAFERNRLLLRRFAQQFRHDNTPSLVLADLHDSRFGLLYARVSEGGRLAGIPIAPSTILRPLQYLFGEEHLMWKSVRIERETEVRELGAASVLFQVTPSTCEPGNRSANR